MSARPVDEGRLLTFEVAGAVFALPIGGILEVAQAGAVCGVPTLPRALAGVMNWHGDALPIVAPHLLVARDAQAPSDALVCEHVLVVSDRGGEVPSLGLPIDAVLGLVEASRPSRLGSAGQDVVVERRSIDGRVVSVLDPRRLVARAKQVIEQWAA